MRALRILLEPECRPLLVHCNKGKVSLTSLVFFLSHTKLFRIFEHLWKNITGSMPTKDIRINVF